MKRLAKYYTIRAKRTPNTMFKEVEYSLMPIYLEQSGHLLELQNPEEISFQVLH